MNKHDTYLKKKTNIIENILRVRLGLQQIKSHPLYCLVIVALIGVFAVIWKYRTSIFNFVYLPMEFINILHYFVSAMLVLTLMLFILIFVKYVGYLSAKDDESLISLAFEEQDWVKGLPILLSKKKIKKGEAIVTVREFYTTIPFERWEKKKEDIADMLNITLVSPYLERGGRKRNKGKRIVIYSVPDRKLQERGQLYDTM